MSSDDEPVAGQTNNEGLDAAMAPPERNKKLSKNLNMVAVMVIVAICVAVVLIALALR